MKTAKLFKNGQSQAVRLPKEFRCSGRHVFIKKIDNIIALIPADNPWQSFFYGIDKFSKDFMVDRKQPQQQIREDIF